MNSRRFSNVGCFFIDKSLIVPGGGNKNRIFSFGLQFGGVKARISGKDGLQPTRPGHIQLREG